MYQGWRSSFARNLGGFDSLLVHCDISILVMPRPVKLAKRIRFPHITPLQNRLTVGRFSLKEKIVVRFHVLQHSLTSSCRQVARQVSAKDLFVGSIPTYCSYCLYSLAVKRLLVTEWSAVQLCLGAQNQGKVLGKHSRPGTGRCRFDSCYLDRLLVWPTWLRRPPEKWKILVRF